MSRPRWKLKHDQKVGVYRLGQPGKWSGAYDGGYRHTELIIRLERVREPLVELGGYLHNKETSDYLTTKARWLKQATNHPIHLDGYGASESEIRWRWQESKERPGEYYGCDIERMSFRDWPMATMAKLRTAWIKKMDEDSKARGYSGGRTLDCWGCEPSPVQLVQLLDGMGFIPYKYESDPDRSYGGESVPDWGFDLAEWFMPIAKEMAEAKAIRDEEQARKEAAEQAATESTEGAECEAVPA